MNTHAETVLELRNRHKRAWEEMLGREVQQFVMDGFGPRLAESAAKINLAVRKEEPEEAVQREGKTLMERMRRLVEEIEDGGLFPHQQRVDLER